MNVYICVCACAFIVLKVMIYFAINRNHDQCVFLARVENILGYSAEDLIGQSVYDYHHGADEAMVQTAYKTCKLHFS